MSFLIAKNAGTPFKESEVWRETMYKFPRYLGFAYAKDGQTHIEKYVDKEIDAGFSRMEELTDVDLIAFFETKKNAAFDKNRDNIPPIPVSDKLAYVVAGDILNLSKKTAAQFSDSFYIKDYLFAPVDKRMPDAFFSFSGLWLLEQFIPYDSAVAFIKGNGNLSFANQSKGFLFKNLWCFDSNYKPNIRVF